MGRLPGTLDCLLRLVAQTNRTNYAVPESSLNPDSLHVPTASRIHGHAAFRGNCCNKLVRIMAVGFKLVTKLTTSMPRLLVEPTAENMKASVCPASYSARAAVKPCQRHGGLRNKSEDSLWQPQILNCSSTVLWGYRLYLPHEDSQEDLTYEPVFPPGGRWRSSVCKSSPPADIERYCFGSGACQRFSCKAGFSTTEAWQGSQKIDLIS